MSILSVTKIFEKLLCSQIVPFMDQFLFKYQRDLMLNIAFLPSWISGRKQLTKKMFLVLFWLISQKHSTVCHVNLLLVNSKLMDLVFCIKPNSELFSQQKTN